MDAEEAPTRSRASQRQEGPERSLRAGLSSMAPHMRDLPLTDSESRQPAQTPSSSISHPLGDLPPRALCRRGTVWNRVWRGYSTRDIASELGVTPKRVEKDIEALKEAGASLPPQEPTPQPALTLRCGGRRVHNRGWVEPTRSKG